MRVSVLDDAARAIAEAEALLIGAGAGMGVDSGLPDFRGDEGFWRAYPPLAELGISFVEMANPRWFQSDPTLAWGFYGHRLNLYRDTSPHGGFDILRRWGESMAGGCFVYTSNVDGQFQAAGYSGNVVECHGSIHHLQCAGHCDGAIWSADGVEVDVDESTFRAVGPLPSCPGCGGLARPNILMFNDWGWLSDRTQSQEESYGSWRRGVRGSRLVVIECGAGSAVPTVRWQCQQAGGTLIRINPREPEGPAGTISIAMGALEALSSVSSRTG
jgi:NAD-dependent SIR2 family protein deacetylase